MTIIHQMFRRHFSKALRSLERVQIINFDAQQAKTSFQSLEYNKKIAFLVSKQNNKAAVSVFQEMKKKSVPFTPETFGHLIRGFANANQIDDAVSLLVELENWAQNSTIPCHVYIPLISAYCRQHRYDKALGIISHMKALGSKPDAFCYLPLVLYFLENKKTYSGFHLVQQVFKQQVLFKEVLLNALFEHFMKQGLGEYSMLTLRFLRRKKISATKRYFTLSLLALQKQGKLIEQLLVIKEMLQLGIQPNFDLLNQLSIDLCSKKYYAESLLAYDLILKYNYFPSVVCTQAYVTSLGALGKVEQVLDFSKVWLAKNNLDIIQSAIQALVACNLPDQAWKMIKKKLAPKQQWSNVVEAIMQGYSTLDQIEEATRIFDQAMQAGVPKSPVMFHILIRGYAKKANEQKVIEYVQTMNKNDIKPTLDTFTSIVMCHALAKEKTVLHHLALSTLRDIAQVKV